MLPHYPIHQKLQSMHLVWFSFAYFKIPNCICSEVISITSINGSCISIRLEIKSVFYYKRENSEQEIEFFVEEGGEAVPVEVKSKRGATPSLNAYIEQYRPQLAYKLIDGNIGEDGCKVTLPQFMAMFV